MKSEILQKLNEITTKITVTNMSERKLKKKGMPGDFLFKENKDYFFNNACNNSVFMEEPAYNTPTTLNNLNYSFSKYVLEFCTVASLIPNKPSIMFYKSFTPEEKIIEALGKDYSVFKEKGNLENFINKPSICFENDSKAFSKNMRVLLEERGKVVPTNSIYIFIYNTDDINIDDAEIFLTLARSRKIFFISLLPKEAKLAQTKLNAKEADYTEFDRLFTHCLTRYICDSDGPVVIERFRHVPIYLKEGVREVYLAINPPKEEYKGPMR